MTDTRTISQLETEGCPWIGCECCKGTMSVPFKMIRQKVRGADAQTFPSQFFEQFGSTGCWNID
jgi:hypothetical protein